MKKVLFIIFFSVVLLLPVFSARAATPVKILLVPGHDDEVWGAQYGNLKEASMNLALATRLYNLFKKDKRFKVYITRDSGGYTKWFADYFSKNKDAILAFEQEAKKKQQNEIENGDFTVKEGVTHNKVTGDTALRLYGINKWANENDISAVVHIHFNDYPRENKWTIGKYKGFVIYMPDGQFANWEESGQLAADIFAQLHKKYSTSNYPPEINGMVVDQKLIAMGSNGTLDASVRSVLVEYSYIYEKKLRTKSTRLAAYKNMANLTAQGIKNYFFPK